MRRLGTVTSTAPLRVRLNGDTVDVPAEAADDFTGASVGTEVLVEVIERRVFAERVR